MIDSYHRFRFEWIIVLIGLSLNEMTVMLVKIFHA